jgi:hypothetical protein
MVNLLHSQRWWAGCFGCTAARQTSLTVVWGACSTLQLQQETWATTAEMLQMAGGGVHEHAHLLAGLFMELGVQVRLHAWMLTAGVTRALVSTLSCFDCCLCW